MHRLDEAIRLAKKIIDLLKDSELDRLEIESVMTSHCVVLLYSECEQRIKAEVKRRCQTHPDHHVSQFAVSTSDLVTGKMTLSDLHGTLRRFSESTKEHFCSAYSADVEPLDIAWDRMFKARLRVAHKGERADTTLDQLEKDIAACRRLVDCYIAALHADTPSCSAVLQNEI